MRVRAASSALLLALAACMGDQEPEGPGASVSLPSPSPSPAASSGDVFIAVKGDWGAASEAQRAVTARMCRLRRRTGFRTVMTTGDNFYPAGSATQATYFRPERCLYQHPRHRWRATWGNHDMDDATRRVLGARRWYAWSEGAADLFALDSNRAGDGRQKVWLQRQLAASRAPVKIAYFHHPPFTSSFHRDNQAVKDAWVPLFERYDVTLVLAGHSHLYEHWNVRGIDYITTGGGGAVLYDCDRERRAMLQRCVSVHHFLLLQITASTVGVTAITRSGRTLDRFVVAAS